MDEIILIATQTQKQITPIFSQNIREQQMN